jgi:hypothetical protein
MNTGAHDDARDWAQEIARIAAHIEELKVWCDKECRLLRANVNTQIADLQADVRRLKADVAAAGPDAYALKISAQIEELTLKGDTAYKWLHAYLVGNDAQNGEDS